jgi:VanZ family protein
VFVLAWLAVIALVTLVPAVSPVPLPATCIICGQLGGVDFALNIGLFVPLGAGLFVALRRAGLATAIGIVVTLAIEFLQLRVIPGRDASLGDLVANTTGTAIGAAAAATMPAWIHATGALAHRLTMTSGAVASAVILAGAWLVLPSLPIGRLAVQWSAPRHYLDPFSGVVRSTWLNGIPIHATQRIHPDSVFDDAAGSIAVRAVVDGPVEPTRRPSMIVALANPIEEGLFLGQLGVATVYRAHTNATRLRFRSPLVRMDGAFAGAAAHDASLTIEGIAAPAFVRLRRTGASGDLDLEYPRTAALAWTVLLPWDIAIGPSWWLACAAWFAVLVLPVAYWAAAGEGVRHWWPCLLPLAAILAGPLVLGVAWPTAADWGGLVAGAMAGVAARRLTRVTIRG